MVNTTEKNYFQCPTSTREFKFPNSVNFPQFKLININWHRGEKVFILNFSYAASLKTIKLECVEQAHYALLAKICSIAILNIRMICLPSFFVSFIINCAFSG